MLKIIVYRLTIVNLKVNSLNKDSLHLMYHGQKFDLYEVVENGHRLVENFIEELPNADQKKMLALLQRSADHGLPQNIEKFRHIRDGLFEFKTFGVRLFCFLQNGKMIILTHGATKQKQKGDPKQYDKAFRLMKSIE